MGSRRTASTVGNMEQTLVRCVALDNHQLSQSALHSKMPMQAMKAWYASHPELFQKRLYDRPGCDSKACPYKPTSTPHRPRPTCCCASATRAKP
jgi:hypothetical protein